MLLRAALEPDRAVLPVVSHQSGAEGGERDARRAVVHALSEHPQAALVRVVADQLIRVCERRLHPDSTLGLIGTSRKSLKLSFVGALAVVLLLALSGCGGDDEDQRATTPTETHTESSSPDSTFTEIEPEPEKAKPKLVPTETVEPPPETSPEEAPGGAGDEEPARSLALFTGEGGRITPRVIRVPSFISIRIELRSADGGPYALAFGREAIGVSGAPGPVSTTIDGLRPGAAVVGRPIGRGTLGTKVRIEATAEPGP